MSSEAHILVVEDNESVTSALRILLEMPGHRVSVAGTVAEAIAIGASDPATLVLLDLTLPDGDGLSAIQSLKACGCRTFIALTGHDDLVTRQRCFDAGCLDVLVKPVPVRELMAKTGVWLAST